MLQPLVREEYSERRSIQRRLVEQEASAEVCRGGLGALRQVGLPIPRQQLLRGLSQIVLVRHVVSNRARTRTLNLFSPRTRCPQVLDRVLGLFGVIGGDARYSINQFAPLS